MPANTLYVGRPTRWGNPFPVDGTRTHNEAVDQHRAWIMQPEQAELRQAVRRDLHGKNLACWCREGETCHADVLLQIANEDGG